MKELMNLLIQKRITPNQLLLLYCTKQGIRTDDLVPSVSIEIMYLQKEKWLDIDNNIQPKTILLLSEAEKLFKNNQRLELFNTIDFIEKVGEFRQIFPVGTNKSTNKPYRATIRELHKKLAKFFTENPNYDWNLVLDATENYVDRYSRSDYNMMRTASYFISKREGSVDTSDLATECELLLDEG